ncbi:MAG: ABC transporter substrate-binding protein [Candidatus Tenebribacter mawsonii]|nr:ABC transporter substrate-binding protein [Candidatus Tenebribacter mawsonii]
MKKIIGLLLLFALLFGCTNSKKDKLIIGIIKPSLNHLTFDFGLATDFLNRDDFVIKNFASGWETNEALISGKIDVAILPFTYAWLDVSNGKKVKIISFLERESDGIIANPSIKTLDQLQGKKLGVLRASTLDIFAELMTEERNLDMEFIYFRTPMDMATALKTGEVDALSFYVPSIFKFNSDYNIVHWYGDDYPLHTCCNITATENAINSKSEMIKKFLIGLYTATDELNKSPDTAYKAVEEFYELYPPYSKQSLYHTKYVMGLDENMKEFEMKTYNKMIEKGYAVNPVKPENVYYKIK